MITLPINDLHRHFEATQDDVRPAIERVLASGWFVLGPQLAQFEADFASYCGVRHCIGVGNGTDALELALRALGLESGDKVVTVANAGMYATTAILAAQGRPLYADVDRESMLMNVDALRAVNDPAVKIVVATHLFGRMADMFAIRAICDERGWKLVEDCAQTHGAMLEGRRAGSFGDAAAFSFYPTKNLGALGDGGAVVTNDVLVHGRVCRLRQYGWHRKYAVETPGGRNSRLDELQAAVLLAKLPKLDGWNESRNAVAAAYTRQIQHPALELPKEPGEGSVVHLFVVRCQNREGLRSHLSSHGIGSDVHYPIPDHHQATMQRESPRPSLPTTESLADEILTLPCFPEMQEQDVLHVVQAVNCWEGT